MLELKERESAKVVSGEDLFKNRKKTRIQNSIKRSVEINVKGVYK